MKKVAGLGCLGFLGLTACYGLTLVVMPAYAVAETVFQLPMFAPQIEAWALGSDPGQESEPALGLGFSLQGYAGPTSFACRLPPEVAALSSPFGNTEGRRHAHQGVDYSTCWCEGYPVRTPFGGMVTYAGDHAVYGGTVVIENRGVTLHLAFQDAHALVKADRFGQSGGNGAQSVNTLLGVLGTHWLFFQAPASAHEIGERLELSREEVGSLSRLKVGEAILVLPDQQHLPLRVVVPPAWLPAFETDMESMQRNLAGAMVGQA